MYKKVMYNIKKMRKSVGVGVGGGGAIFEPKTLSMYLEKEKEKKVKKKKKKFKQPGFEPTTSGLEIHYTPVPEGVSVNIRGPEKFVP